MVSPQCCQIVRYAGSLITLFTDLVLFLFAELMTHNIILQNKTSDDFFPRRIYALWKYCKRNISDERKTIADALTALCERYQNCA
jgi:hypothetical protein